MADRFSNVLESAPGRMVTRRLGVPEPTPLRRYEPGQPLLDGPALLGGEGRLRSVVEPLLPAPPAGEDAPLAAAAFDASGLTGIEGVRRLYEFFHPLMRRIGESGRVLVLGTPPEDCDDPAAAIAQRALEGFTRSVAKELRHGATAQTLLVAPGAEAGAESTLRFLLSARSAYVNGQAIRVGPGDAPAPAD